MYKRKKYAITGISGSLGKSLCLKLREKGAYVIGLTHRKNKAEKEYLPNSANYADEIHIWDVNIEDELQFLLQDVEVLILNHGVNLRGNQTPKKFNQSIDVNALSMWKLINIFESLSIKKDVNNLQREIWVNTSESEILPSLSYSYEISKRLIGQLVSFKIFDLNTKDQNLIMRKIVLGPFKSKLNPRGVMKSDNVALKIIKKARLGKKLIIVSPYFFSYIIFPINELLRNLYFRFIIFLNFLLDQKNYPKL